MMILNLTQHSATADQRSAGVIDLSDSSILKDLLTFENVPLDGEMVYRAHKIVSLCIENRFCAGSKVMIGGAPFFMSTLERVLMMHMINPVYSFSQRKSIETTLPDGSVEKKAVFAHVCFVEATSGLGGG
jgi:hypothetical protein